MGRTTAHLTERLAGGTTGTFFSGSETLTNWPPRHGRPSAGLRMDKNGLVQVFRGVAKRAGVDRRGVSLHTLRHTFASLLLQEGADLVSIKEMLGRADLPTTAIYLQMDAAHLQGAVERHPLSG